MAQEDGEPRRNSPETKNAPQTMTASLPMLQKTLFACSDHAEAAPRHTSDAQREKDDRAQLEQSIRFRASDFDSFVVCGGTQKDLIV
jgi:hypothetical protein